MGYTTVLTRESDYYLPIQLRPRSPCTPNRSSLSQHPSQRRRGRVEAQRPGTEVYHQVQSATAKRFAGLLWEEIVNSFTKNYKVPWVGASDAGAIYRPDKDGKTDFFGVLRRTYPTIPAVLIEAGYMTNPQEATLMDRTDYRERSASGGERGEALPDDR